MSTILFDRVTKRDNAMVYDESTTNFFSELKRLRKRNTKTGREGYKELATRLGISKSQMDAFRRGLVPDKYTISGMVKKGGYNNSTLINLQHARKRDQEMMKEMHYTRFYEELDKLRLDDPASPTGKESDRAMGTRLGITNKTITLYRRGAQPKTTTILQIVEKGGYGADMFHRLSAAAAGEEVVKPMSESCVGVFAAEDVDRNGPRKTAKPLFDFTPPKFLNKNHSRSSLMCIKIGDDYNNCEPNIPKGSCLLFANVPCEPENFKLYVFATPKGAVPRLVRVHGRQLWWSKSNLSDLEKVDRDEFDDAVLGKIIMVMNFTEDH